MQPATPPFLNAVSDCGCDNTGANDTTARLQACIDRAYGHTIPRVPVWLPTGTYLLSATVNLQQDNPGPDDGINVVPGRFLPHVLIGQPISTGVARPALQLAASSPGFNATSGYTPLVHIFSDNGEGVDMNNLFKGIDIDLTQPGNPSAVGVSHAGAQGATVTDVTVRAGNDTLACFAGLNGAGGEHANIACYGARYGLYMDDCQPVPVAVGVTLVNQSVSAISFFCQETLSLVGAAITVAPWATGPAITTTTQGMSLVDVSISCSGALAGGQVAVSTTRSLFARDLFVSGCGTAIQQQGAPTVPGPPAGLWLQMTEYAKGANISQYYIADVVYEGGVRTPGGLISRSVLLPQGGAPPPDLLSRHMWDEAAFPDRGSPGVADARADCGAVGDGTTDDTAALQACLTAHGSVFLPPGAFRTSATLDVPPGGSLVGMGNGASYLMAATGGFPGASEAEPQPMVRTSADAGPEARPTTLAFVGIVTWQHLAHVFTLDWRTQHPMSLWRTNFESRDCECLWLSAYQALAPPVIPCSPPVNITIPKTVIRGLGRIHEFVNDDTGHILSTGAAYRALLVADTVAFAGPAARTRFYSLNLEHAQSETNSEVRNASFVDIYSVKSEGNTPITWVRSTCANVSILGLGGGLTAFANNFTQPPDFSQLSASTFRVDPGATGITFAALLDHGYGAEPPYWPPNRGGCHWLGHYPYPGQAVAAYPFWTYPNATMWNCWFGTRCATAYWWMVSDGQGSSGVHSTPMDKPIYYATG